MLSTHEIFKNPRKELEDILIFVTYLSLHGILFLIKNNVEHLLLILVFQQKIIWQVIILSLGER